MSGANDVTYLYDGTFEGFLCCVFASYAAKELPTEIVPWDRAQGSLLTEKTIETDAGQARRVLDGIRQKISPSVLAFTRRAFLTCMQHKELSMLLFLRLGFRVGPSVAGRLADPTVDRLAKAVRYLERESHFYKEFIRFSEVGGGALVAEIEPKNFVLPLLADHFCGRFPEERFLIYDKTHFMGLVYEPYKVAVVPIESLELPPADAVETAYQDLWRAFYDAIEIKERHNPKCRMTHMPKRYWSYMTEFCRGASAQKEETQRLPAIKPRGADC